MQRTIFPHHLPRWCLAVLLAATTLIAPGSPAASAAHDPVTPRRAIASGDLVLSLCGTDTVAEYTPLGQYVQDLMTPADGLQAPTGSAFDRHNNLYVTDFGGNQILERSSFGQVTVFSNQTILANGHTYNSPESIAVSGDGATMYVSNANRDGPNGGIDVVDTKTGKGLGFLPLPSSDGSMSKLRGQGQGKGESDWLGLDRFGRLYMTNENRAQGLMQVDLKSGDIKQPSLIANLPNYGYAFGFDRNGHIWLADSTQVIEYTAKGKVLKTIPTAIRQAFSAMFDPTASRFHVADYTTGTVETYNLAGTLAHSFTVQFQQICGISVYHGFLP